jgi:lactate permease
VPILSLPPPVLSVLSALPLVTLLGGLVGLNWSARRSAIAGFLVAVGIGVLFFGMGPQGLGVAIVKGLLLALVVLLVVWFALLLFSIVDRLGAIESIGAAMVNATDVPTIRALMIGWGFSGFLQGIAGFGAPVASVVPLLAVAGFEAVPSIAAAMVGHSWAITFGSVGSSFLAIQLVTRLPGETLAPWIAGLFALPILLTGISVLHILLGWDGVRRGLAVVVPVAAGMAVTMWVVAGPLQAGPIASTVPALVACGMLWLFGRRHPATGELKQAKVSFHLAFLPYYLLILLTLATQVGPLADFARSVSLGFDFPATRTALGYQVSPEAGYPRLRILTHPAAIITFGIIGTMLVYRAKGLWPSRTLRSGLVLTFRRSIVSSTAVAFMVTMALVMTDSGMTRALAEGVRALAGPAFPLLSPFLGVLGAFMTGSNTNSNIMMGGLQRQTAEALFPLDVLAVVLIAAAQTVGGSLGSGVSPDKAVIGAAVAGVTGQEGRISRRAVPYGLLTVAVVGVEVLLLATVFTWVGR